MRAYSKKQLKVLLGTVLLMMAYALAHTSVGYFVAPVTETLHIPRAAFTFYYTLLQLVSIVVIPVFSRLISRLGSRKLLVIGALWGGIGFLGFSISRSVWMFYFFGIWLGIAVAGCTSLVAAVIIYDWFGEQSGTPMGITMAGTGICGILQGFLMPALIEALGWQSVYRLMAGFWFAALIVGAFLSGGQAGKTALKEEKPADEQKINRRVKFTPTLVVFMVIIVIVAIPGLFIHHMQAHYSQQGVSARTAGLFMSVFNVFVITFKISLGVMHDRIGAVKTLIIAWGLFAVGAILALSSSPIVLFVSLAMLALGMSSETVLPPLLTRSVFGAEDYAVTYGRVSMAYNFGAAFASPIWGAVYDGAGSYLPGLWVTPVVLLVNLGLMVILIRRNCTCCSR